MVVFLFCMIMINLASMLKKKQREFRLSNTFNSFWAGGELSPLAWACYASFGSNRHNVVIYSYEDIDVPPGATVEDARHILPKEKLFKALDSYAPFSDLFRLELLLRKGGWWVDADVICTRRLMPTPPQDLYAWEDDLSINNGQLRLRKNSKIAAKALKNMRKIDSSHRAWGDSGPQLLTATLRKMHLLGKAKPRKFFYPLHWLETYKFFLEDEASCIESLSRSGNFIHAFGSMFKYFGFETKIHAPQPGSYLDKLYTKTDVYGRFSLGQPDWLEISRKISEYLSDEWISEYLQQQSFSLDLVVS
jgi:hypothetical protein